MQAIFPKIQLQVWKTLFFPTILIVSISEWCCIGDNKVWAVNLDAQANLDLTVSNITDSEQTETNQHLIYFLHGYSQVPVEEKTENVNNSRQQEEAVEEKTENVNNFRQQEEAVEAKTENVNNSRQQGEADNLPKQIPNATEQLFNRSEPIEIPLQKLQEQTQLPPESDVNQELGLRVRPKPQEGIPPVESKPIGYLKARVGYFQASNIFSAQDNPIEDGLVFSGLTLTSKYFPLSNNTYVVGSIDGNLIRYIDQSKYSYNQLRLNLGIYQQLSKKMYGELSWNNQQLFYAQNGDFFQSGERFLNEHSLRLSLGRRDTFSEELILDSVYDLSVNFADPESRSRVMNSFWVSLNYYIQKPLQVGINYQLNLSDFTQRDREDQLHRLYANLNYNISKTSNVNLLSGVSFGDSSQRNIDFSSWFFSVNYNFELGRF